MTTPTGTRIADRITQLHQVATHIHDLALHAQGSGDRDDLEDATVHLAGLADRQHELLGDLTVHLVKLGVIAHPHRTPE